MKEPQSEDHKTQANSDQYQTTRKEIIGNMSTPPNTNAASNPGNNREKESQFPEKPEMPRSIIKWFRSFHLNREKPKITDHLTVVLTLVVAIAAFWSACIFQGQLTEMRRGAIVDQRAWVAPFDIQSEHNSIGEIYFKVLYKNTGKTPALRTSSWIGTTAFLDQIPNSDPVPKLTDAQGLMAPDGIWNTSTIDHAFKPVVIAPI